MCFVHICFDLQLVELHCFIYFALFYILSHLNHYWIFSAVAVFFQAIFL